MSTVLRILLKYELSHEHKHNLIFELKGFKDYWIHFGSSSHFQPFWLHRGYLIFINFIFKLDMGTNKGLRWGWNDPISDKWIQWHLKQALRKGNNLKLIQKASAAEESWIFEINVNYRRNVNPFETRITPLKNSDWALKKKINTLNR